MVTMLPPPGATDISSMPLLTRDASEIFVTLRVSVLKTVGCRVALTSRGLRRFLPQMYHQETPLDPVARSNSTGPRHTL